MNSLNNAAANDFKTKSVRERIREEIETIVKENDIDRKRFYEYSKFAYSDVLKRFYYSFADYEAYPYDPRNGLYYCWLHFRKELKITASIRCFNFEWSANLQKLKHLMPDVKDKKLYLILSENWVYEGYIDEIISVLNETDMLLEDFYIVSQKYDWFVSYCDDGDCAVIYRK